MVWVSGEGKLRPWSEFGVFFGVGVDEGALVKVTEKEREKKVTKKWPNKNVSS